ncbi:hypothetical protein TREMEDRAFT_68510 [Tremella mesenterica DSM 1558]|uniref:uncharacterized protein n=1 Tax=Tremella mesenterica (strain ATCC 24925 / CBS 8224 / DSM 1558 / NBRC 9311 / NRRL Y-6157 / RJB 2259-6 / UBC 559-6) TaxID=578456 RepID=UPI0003F4A46F|nr:uncharacterized protein TREMEDRAFT_68510 [Tremella mesenterica DSM 1558]EIW70140.1 hypothetical protein TREMEDRAFT_68510 [Tremella mesenterica DSM 1558]
MPPVKRTADDDVYELPVAKKTHPFFTPGVKSPGTFLPSPPTLIHFLHLDPFDRPGSSQVPVVFYDLDGTLIKTRKGGDFPSSRDDWQWWHDTVPSQLKSEWESRKHIIVLSNQGDSREKIRNEWKAKLPLIAAKMPSGVPLRILAALNKFDIYRKPNTGMFDEIVRLYRNQRLEIDMENSVYVGDAAGRAGHQGRKKDHGDSDFKLAINVGIKEHFPNPPNGFRPSKSLSLKRES